MKKNYLAIVVLTWNDYENTILCIKSLIKQTFKNFKIILVDNGSTDRSLIKIINWLKKKNFSPKIVDQQYQICNNNKIYIIKNEKNLGCGFGHNSGYNFAINNNFKITARIDNDMEAPRIFLKKILKNFKNLNVQAVSPKIMYKHNKNLIWWMGTRIGQSLKMQTHMRDYEYGLIDKQNYKEIKKTDAIAGCASFMRTERLKTVGLSDKDFFYGPEDVELSFRLKINSKSLIVDNDVKIYHGVTQSFRSLNKKRIYFEYKYRLLLIKKIGTFWDKFFGYQISLIKFSLYLFLFFIKKHRIKIIPVFYAIIHFFQNKLGDFDRKNKKFLSS
jgi:GT2 family glycosyltransferase